MGGNVRVESEGEGHGTQFIIQLSAFSSVKQSDLPTFEQYYDETFKNK
jgi:hypothetical protein